MKILILLGSAEVGGTERQVLGLSRHLAIAHEVTVVFFRFEGPLIDDFIDSGARLIDLSTDSNSKNYSIIKSILKFRTLLKNEDFDVIHMYLPESVIIGYLTYRTTLLSTPIIAGVRGSMWKRGRISYAAYKYSLRKFDQVVCNTHELRNICLTTYKVLTERIDVIPNGVNMHVESKGRDYAQIRVVYVANFHSYKGHEILVKAIKQTKSQVIVRFVGDGETRSQIENLVREYGLENRIFFMGRIDPTNSYQWANLMIHPSETEGMSNSILEGISWGLPVLAFEIGGNSELVTSGWNGMLLSAKSPKALAETMDGLLPEQLETMGNNSFIRSKNYNWENLSKKHLDLYSKLLNNR